MKITIRKLAILAVSFSCLAATHANVFKNNFINLNRKTLEVVPFSDRVVQWAPHKDLLATQLKDYVPPKKHHIVVVSPSYKNADWYEKNLASVYGQDYENFSHVYIDDKSPDKTAELVAEYIKKHKQELRTTLIANQVNQGACANWYQVVNSLPPEAIVVCLDGDDFFATPQVLSLVNKIYNKYDVLMTYGSYQEYPFKKKRPYYSGQIPTDIINKNKFRDYKWVASHLRTFKAGLMQRIKKEDLLHNGAFFPMVPDLVLTFPMLEMAGIRSMFVPDVLYIYNRATPLNEGKVHREKLVLFDRLARAKTRYIPLPEGSLY